MPGLIEFVEAARDRALALGAIERWHMEVKNWGMLEAHAAELTAAEVADEVWRQCLGGQFRHAVNTSVVSSLDLHPEQIEDLAWMAFHEAVCVAERIDSLLAVLEREGVSRQLARDCRGDLDLLPVLADYCTDAGLPRTAAEVRHLHGLVRLHR
jgi:hypothetical protein